MARREFEEDPTHIRQEMIDVSDYFAWEETIEGLGPTDPVQAEFFADADERKYIDERPSTGIHCMDDNVTLPGIQLPGGWLETTMAGEYMNHRARKLKVSQQYRRLVPKLAHIDPSSPLWVHGIVCAAGTYKKDGLLAIAEDPSGALAFTGLVLEHLKLDVPEREINEAIFTAGERADDERLWDISFHSGMDIARRNRHVQYEEFRRDHILAGLRIDATPHRFNNGLFRNEHVSHAQEVGVLSVTIGAYREYLEERAARGAYRPDDIPMAVTYANLFTFGLARAKVHSYTQAGLVIPKLV